MNAAARLVHQGILSRRLVLTYLLTRSQLIALMLSVFVLFSSLSIVYVTHAYRVTYATYQQSLLEKDRLHVERTQLLLERSTLMMQHRIQQIAENKLDMVVPKQISVVIVHEK